MLPGGTYPELNCLAEESEYTNWNYDLKKAVLDGSKLKDKAVFTPCPVPTKNTSLDSPLYFFSFLANFRPNLDLASLSEEIAGIPAFGRMEKEEGLQMVFGGYMDTGIQMMDSRTLWIPFYPYMILRKKH